MSHPPSPLCDEEKRALLELARRAIHEFIVQKRIPDFPPPAGGLGQKCGVFVSLHRHGRLRGCIGQLDGLPNLAEGVVRCAIAAALDDPRFAPVGAEEIAGLEIEISILSKLEPVRPEEIVAGRHGLLVTQGPFRGLLLPQVATEYGWNSERFLEETCVKAGLPREAWRDSDTLILAFTAEVFSEALMFPARHARAS